MASVVLLVLVSLLGASHEAYSPMWDSLDSRPLPAWYDRAKIGIFLHWGVYSVPSFDSEWFWLNWQDRKVPALVDYMKRNFPPSFTYQDFGKDFTAEFFSPADWADLIAKSGAKYVVLTSKHHEGYALWPSKYSFGWNSMDVGSKRDLVGELGAAVRAKNLHFGLYYSLWEFFHPLHLEDTENGFKSTKYVDSKMIPEMKELVSKYKPDILWPDGNWIAPDTYWKSLDFLTWLYNESPVKDTVVTNDRWGNNTGCKHGGYLTCTDGYSPGALQPKKWENCMTVDRGSWGYRRNAQLSDFITSHDLLVSLAETIAYGGNLLFNVGPTKEGTIPLLFQERLLDLGRWLEINGEAIYESQPYVSQNDTLTKMVYYTSKGSNVYAIVLNF